MYYTESLKPRSEKITLVTCEASERLKLFTSIGGNDYERVVDNFVVGVKNGSTALTSASLPLSLNQYNFNPLTKTLTIDVGANPSTQDVSVTYRLFFSNAPVNLPYDLSTGTTVEWEPYVVSVGSIGQQLDNENTGIVLESSSSVNFINTDGRFDSIFDKYIWENKQIKFYSWFAGTPIAENVQLFDGVIESKTFSSTQVSFKVKDFVYKLKNKVNLGLFSDADGQVLPSLIGKAKRRIYGQADYVKCASVTAILDGYAITGTTSCTLGTVTLTGTGTSFLSELCPGDDLIYTINGIKQKLAVQDIASNTSLTLGKITEFEISGLTPDVMPKIPSRYKNRTWHVSSHKLRAPISTITSVVSENRFVVDTVLDIFENDLIVVNGVETFVRRVSGNTIVTNSAISPLPAINDLIQKSPISVIHFGSNELTFTRDYTIANGSICTFTLNALAEFNITSQLSGTTALHFTNGSRTVTTTANVDLRSFLKTRDWIRSSNITKSTWYEILSVEERTIEIRVAFADATATETFYYKNVEYIDENSLLTANCLGLENANGDWVRTASDAVRDLVLNDALFSAVDEASFTKANADCDYTLSMVIPEQLGDSAPIIRDVISNINESVFGALYGNSSHLIAYSIFNSTKPESLSVLTDDDILSFSVQTNQAIVNSASIKYRPFIDIYTGQDAFLSITASSAFVDKMIGIKNTLEKTIYLYSTSDATIVAQRLCFFKSLANSVITIKSKMNLAHLVVSDKMYLTLDRLFKRYAGNDKRRIGVISGIKKDGFGCEVSLSDLGNIYNRVMSIAPNSTPDYASATSDDTIRWGFIVDNNTETPDVLSETGLGSNLIG